MDYCGIYINIAEVWKTLKKGIMQNDWINSNTWYIW